jgi:hypothetical protein
MSQQQQLLKKQELTVSQILRTCGKQFTQIIGWYTDGRNGRCAAGVLMSYYGWNGRDFFDIARSLNCTLHLLKNAGIKLDFIAELNDSGRTFDEIADFLDKFGRLADSKK